MISTIRFCNARRRFFRSTRRALWFRRSSMMSSECSTRCRAFWRSFCSSFLLSFLLRWWWWRLGRKFAWVLVLFVPVIIFSAGRIGRRVRHATRRGQDKLADIQNILHETITGNRIVKAFSMERWEIARFQDAAQRLFRANLRSVAAVAISSPLMDIFGAIAIALLLLLGREQINHHVFSSGTFLAFIVAVFKLYDPVRKFALFNNNFQQALGASSEIFKFMDTDDDVKEKPGARPLPPFSRSIRFENVCFSYDSEGEGPGDFARYQSRGSCRRGAGGGRIEWRR